MKASLEGNLVRGGEKWTVFLERVAIGFQDMLLMVRCDGLGSRVIGIVRRERCIERDSWVVCRVNGMEEQRISGAMDGLLKPLRRLVELWLTCAGNPWNLLGSLKGRLIHIRS